MRAILTCKCNDTPEYAKDAFSIIFPDEEIPEVYSGTDRIYSFARQLPENGSAYQYVMSISKNRDRFAYYIKEESGELVHMMDLLNKRRLA